MRRPDSNAARDAATRLPWGTYLLSLAQAINLTAAVISVTVAAFVGAALAPHPALATVAYGMQFLGIMVATYPAAMFMRRYGRRAGFFLGAGALVLAGAVGYDSVMRASFAGLVVSHTLLGLYTACANFYRFAAVDQLATALKPRGVSLVVAGGVAAAVLGPLIAQWLRVVPGQAEFALVYASFSVLGLLTALLMAIWRPGPTPPPGPAPRVIASPSLTARRPVVVAMLAAGLGYFIMNLLMVQSTMVMKGICSFAASSHAIQAHVIAMFAPSFVTGGLIARIGVHRVLLLGFALLIGAAVIGGARIEYLSIFIGLVLLGVGWNFTYVGGGALLAETVPEHARHRWQGINDSVIAVCATAGAFLPAPLLSGLGWAYTNLYTVPLSLIGIVVCWRALVLARKTSDRHALAIK